MELKIKEEFRDLIPKLTQEEFKSLEISCLKDGIRDVIVTWKDIIIDGHNRFEIANNNSLGYETIEMQFDSEEQVKEWMINNQFARRNINAYQRSLLALELENLFKDKAKGNQGVRTDLFPTLGRSKTIHTHKEISKKANVSHGTIDKVKLIKKQATPEQKEQLITGEVSINNIFTEIKKEEKKTVLNRKKEEIINILKKDVINNKPIIYNQDFKIFLNNIKDKSVDLLITDPPYSTDIDDVKYFAESWVELALSKVKDNGRAFICIGAYPKEIKVYFDILLNQNRFILDNPLIWTYKNTLGITPKMKYNLNYQLILHLYSNESDNLDTSITSEMWNVQEINAPDGRHGDRYHTWQKPNELGLRLIRHSTKEKDIIIDPFACTGTFPLMAAKLNRIATGCDISKENLLIAKNRGCHVQ